MAGGWGSGILRKGGDGMELNGGYVIWGNLMESYGILWIILWIILCNESFLGWRMDDYRME